MKSPSYIGWEQRVVSCYRLSPTMRSHVCSSTENLRVDIRLPSREAAFDVPICWCVVRVRHPFHQMETPQNRSPPATPCKVHWKVKDLTWCTSSTRGRPMRQLHQPTNQGLKGLHFVFKVFQLKLPVSPISRLHGQEFLWKPVASNFGDFENKHVRICSCSKSKFYLNRTTVSCVFGFGVGRTIVFLVFVWLRIHYVHGNEWKFLAGSGWHGTCATFEVGLLALSNSKS